jgi:hypothetical protein
LVIIGFVSLLSEMSVLSLRQESISFELGLISYGKMGKMRTFLFSLNLPLFGIHNNAMRLQVLSGIRHKPKGETKKAAPHWRYGFLN